MKWKRAKGRRNRDVIDIRGPRRSALRRERRRGLQIPASVAGLGGGAGIVVVIVIVAIQVFSGGGGGFDLNSVFGTGVSAPGAGNPARSRRPRIRSATSRSSRSTSSTTCRTPGRDLQATGSAYRPAKLVLYSDAVRTGGCGGATSAAGPFYCPADQRVYLDLSFYDEMKRQLGAPGDFAWAYVIAHEVGHHVQNLLGTEQPGRAA